MGIFKVAVTKGGDLIEVDTDKITAENWEKIVLMGLKHFTNVKMTKVTKAAIPDDEERKAEAMKVAAENIEAMYTGNLRVVGMKSAKAKGPAKSALRTVAMAEARARVKAQAKAMKIKLAHLEAKDITRWASEMLDHPEAGPPIWAKAEQILAEREATDKATDLSAFGINIAISDRKVKQDAGKRERAKATMDEPAGLSVPAAHVIAAQANRPGQGAPGRR